MLLLFQVLTIILSLCSICLYNKVRKLTADKVEKKKVIRDMEEEVRNMRRRIEHAKQYLQE